MSFVIPFLAIYMICKNKIYYRFISGSAVLTVTILLIIIWLYPLICGNNGNNFFDYKNSRHFSIGEILAMYLMVLVPLIGSFGGMFIFWKRGKILGSVVILIGVIVFGIALLMALLNGVL